MRDLSSAVLWRMKCDPLRASGVAAGKMFCRGQGMQKGKMGEVVFIRPLICETLFEYCPFLFGEKD